MSELRRWRGWSSDVRRSLRWSRAGTHHRGHGGTQRTSTSLRSGGGRRRPPLHKRWVGSYLRIGGRGGSRAGCGLGWAAEKPLASHRGTDEGVRPYTDMGGKTDGYHLADGTDCGGGRDMELGEYGEGGARRDHARHRQAD